MTTAPGTEFGHSPVVSVSGTPLADEVARLLESVVVDQAVGLPGSALLRLRDPDLRALSQARLTVGAAVTVAFNRPGAPAVVTLLEGEVTALEYEYDARGSVVVVRCHDALHRLTRGRRTRSWSATDDATVARAVLAGAGVPVGTVEGSALRHDHVAQLDVSDWDFLTARARAVGRVLFLQDGKAHVRARPTVGAGAPLELVVGQNLKRLRVRVTSAGQVPSVEVRGWDPTTQRAVEGRVRPRGDAARAGLAHTRLTGGFAAPPLHVGDPALTSVAEARAVAEGLAARTSDVHAELEGTCGGDPRLQPGVSVKVAGTGPDHDGTYVLTRVRHESTRYGYSTHVECGGGEDRTLRGLVGGAGAAPTGAGSRPVPGVTVGVVTDVKDPTRKGRVKVSFPWLSGSYASDWARLVVPGGGDERGLAWLPEVNDEVLVAFEHGDTRRPYVVGGLWSPQAPPPLQAELVDAAGRTAVRAMRSRTGQRLVLSDETGRAGVTVATGDDALQIRLDTASTTVVVDSRGRVEVRGAQDVTVSAGARLVLEGTAGVHIKGATVSLEAQADVTVRGAVIRLN